MTWIDVAVVALFVIALAIPIVAALKAVRWHGRRRALHADALAARGSVHTYEVHLMMGSVIFIGGSAMLGAAFLPMLVWIFDTDAEARRVFLSMLGVVAAFVILAVLISWPSLRVWIAEDEQLTVRRMGRERSIRFDAITGIRERRTLLGRVDVDGNDDAGHRIHVKLPSQMSGFDELVALVRNRAPGVEFRGLQPDRNSSADEPAAPASPLGEPVSYAVSKARTRAVVVFMSALLIFFWAWPWKLVTGEHPVRDSFIFAGIGTGFWLIILLLVWQESFQARYPAALELRPNEIAWRRFRGRWESRPRTELLSASVETDIRYVRGFPGYLYPLVLTFTGGRPSDRIELDLMRAKHMGTTTQALAAEFHRRYFDPDLSEVHEPATAAGWLGTVVTADEVGDAATAIDALERAIALHPSADNLARLRELGDRLRRSDENVRAVSAYRAHLDFVPTDASAWEGLAASQRAIGREDLAAEATQAAERILLRPSG